MGGRGVATVLGLAGALGAGLLVARAEPGEERPPPVVRRLLVDASVAPPGPPRPAPAPVTAAEKAAEPPVADTVTVSFRSSPSAVVVWGRKRLGTTPFTLKWPRDSGPLDVVFSAGGHLPLHTRAYTFKDEVVSVKLTRVADKHLLFGYKEELPPEEEVLPDASAPFDPEPAVRR